MKKNMHLEKIWLMTNRAERMWCAGYWFFGYYMLSSS